jgi:hypothetical protein
MICTNQTFLSSEETVDAELKSAVLVAYPVSMYTLSQMKKGVVPKPQFSEMPSGTPSRHSFW